MITVQQLSWLHGVVPGVMVVVGSSSMIVLACLECLSFLYAISGGWLKISATSVGAFRKLQFFRMILRTRIVEGWYRRLKISFSSAAVIRLGCNICCRGISLTKSIAIFIKLLG